MSKLFGDWSVVEPLGRGGQGVVYRVFDSGGRIGALKKFSVTGSKSRRAKLVTRIEREVTILNKIKHKNVVKLLDFNLDQNWLVMEYQTKGTLDNHLHRYRGQHVAALSAFRPLVEVVANLHAEGVIHRDIKLRNVFVSEHGDLVLGDFGLVFPDELTTRVTRTNERVGSRDWIAPWADTPQRLENPSPTLDVFCLGKVLWCMLSGARFLPFWYHRRKEYDLCEMFKWDDQDGKKIPNHYMIAINSDILDNCIVEREEKCLPSAKELLRDVDWWLELWADFEPGGKLAEQFRKLWETQTITRFNPERGPEGGPEQERPCPDCAGRGVDQKGQTCSRCNGSGVIVKR
jgi:serine/threonine protein kinase